MMNDSAERARKAITSVVDMIDDFERLEKILTFASTKTSTLAPEERSKAVRVDRRPYAQHMYKPIKRLLTEVGLKGAKESDIFQNLKATGNLKPIDTEGDLTHVLVKNSGLQNIFCRRDDGTWVLRKYLKEQPMLIAAS
jgi:hypothetical protein